ncbi:MAG: polysaccharide deacetylase family protein [Alphaproteobacteria bacterium]|nr:polysaccharide deacetylase family protein [Alphaproteobacteria bacterium]
MTRILISTLLTFTFWHSPAYAQKLIEAHMSIAQGRDDGPKVALTFDACTGKADNRILDALIQNNIAATIFVTARWLKVNPNAITRLKSRPDLFEIENHGARHVPAIDEPLLVYGIASAGTPAAVKTEVTEGAKAVTAAFGTQPHWFRGATALYTASSEKLITDMKFKIAGFSISGDGGASYSSPKAARAISGAKDGDVIIAHINQPLKPAGAGVVKGILMLKSQGYEFVTLDGGASQRGH